MLVRGLVMRPDLGFIPVTVTPSIVASFNLEVDRGVLAVQVEPSKPAELAGLTVGDVIMEVDGNQMYNTGDFWHAYLRSGGSAPAQLTVFGKKGQVTMTLPRFPSPAAAR